MRFSFSGIDDLQKELTNLSDKVSSLNDSQIPFDDLFTESFMTQHANVSSFDLFLEQGGFTANSQEEFEAIPDDKLDQYVSASTDFKSWDAMLSAATDIYISNFLDN